MYAYHLLKLKRAAERAGGSEVHFDDESSRVFHFFFLLHEMNSNAITL